MPGSPALWAGSFNQNIRTVPKILIDKIVIFGNVNSIILIKFLFPEDVGMEHSIV